MYTLIIELSAQDVKHIHKKNDNFTTAGSFVKNLYMLLASIKCCKNVDTYKKIW